MKADLIQCFFNRKHKCFLIKTQVIIKSNASNRYYENKNKRIQVTNKDLLNIIKNLYFCNDKI